MPMRVGSNECVRLNGCLDVKRSKMLKNHMLITNVEESLANNLDHVVNILSETQ